MNLLWFENLLLMRLWVWNAYLVLLWNRALAYPRALLPSGGPLSREFCQLTTPLTAFFSTSSAVNRWVARGTHFSGTYNPVNTNICITLIQRRPNVFDAGPTLYKCYTIFFCLLGILWLTGDDVHILCPYICISAARFFCVTNPYPTDHDFPYPTDHDFSRF